MIMGLIVTGIPVLVKAGTFGVDERVILEKELASRAEDIVKRITGSDEVIAVVTIVPNTEIRQETQTSGGIQTDLSKLGARNEENVLPGITASDLSGGSVSGNAGGNIVQTISVPQEFISKMTVNILITSKVSRELVDRAKKEVTMLLGLNLE